MKISLNIVVLTLAQMLFVNLLSAQYNVELGDYRCDIAIRAYDPNGHNPKCDNYYEFYTKFVGEGEVLRSDGNKNNLDDISDNSSRWSTYNLSFIIPGNKQLEYVKFYTKRKRKSNGNCVTQSSGDKYCYFSGRSIYPCVIHSFTDIWKAYTANATYTFTPVRVKLFNGEGISTDGVLPENQNVTYKVNRNYSGGRFTWYYGTSASYMPNVLPCGNGASATFSGQTIKTAYLGAIKNSKRIYIKASPGCSTTVSTLGLDVPKEAPHLLSASAQLNTPLCANEATGSVKINISPSVLNNELLYVAIQEDDLKYYSNTVLRAGASFIEFKNLPSGKYEIVFLSGSYPNASRPTYVGDPLYHKYKFELQDPPVLTMQGIGTQDVHCNGGKDGKVRFTAGGGTGNLYVLCDGNNVSVNKNQVAEISGLGVGGHQLRLRDGKECFMRDALGNEQVWSFTVGQPDRPVMVQQESLTEPTGYGRSDGEIRVVARDGSQSGYTYVWEKDGSTMGGSTAIQNGLSAGTYRIWARDGNYNLAFPQTEENVAGCRAFVDIPLNQPRLLTAAIQLQRNITCNGYGDGELSVTADGGVGGYEYQWQVMYNGSWINKTGRDAANDWISGLMADTYRVLVWDRNNNYAESAAFQFIGPAPYSVGFTLIPPLCQGGMDGKVEATVTGNNGGYTYRWRGTAETASFIWGEAGLYTVTVSDRLGCETTQSVTLGEPVALQASYSITEPSAASASDGSITILPQGGTPGYTYLWDYHGATTNPLTGIPADSTPYRVVVKDAHNCQVDVEARMIYPLGVKIAIRKPISCKGDSDGLLEAMPEGGVSRAYSYQWYRKGEGGMEEIACDQSVTGALGEGIYQVKVWDSEHNQAISPEFTFRQPDSLRLDFRHMDPLCKDGSDGWLEALAGGGTQPYHYAWGDRPGWDAQKLGDLPCGTFAVEITDSHGCRISGRDSLTEPDSLLVTHEVRFPSRYGGADGMIHLFPVGGTEPYRYRWAYGNADTNPLTGLSASDTPYEVTVTDSHGCIVVDTPRMYNPLVAEIRVRDSISCYGRSDGRLAVVLAGGVGAPYSFRWFGKNEAGRFIPVGTNDSILYQVAGGIYRVEVRDCTDSLAVSQPFVFRQPDTLQLHFAQKHPECKHDRNGWTQAIVAGGTTPYHYVWTDQQTDGMALRENLPDGSYEVVVTDRRGCLISGQDTLTEPDSLIVKHKVTLPAVFGGADGVILLEPEGGTSPYRYVWDYNNSTDNPLTGVSARTAPLRAVVTDAHGCQATDSAYMYNPVTIELEESGVIICSGQTNAELTAHVKGGAGRPYRFEWYFVEDDLLTRFEATDSLLKPIGVGTYRVVAYDSVDNMGWSADYTIYSPDSLRMEFEIGDLPCKYDRKGWIQAIPLGGEAPYRLEWFNGSADTRVENLEEGRYEVKLTDKRGCFITRKVKINSPDELLLSIDSRAPLGWHGRDGAIWVTPVGGTQPWRYQWQGYNNDRDTLDAIPAGAYTVTVTDQHQCCKTISGIVTEPPLLEVRTSCTRIISCYGLADGVLLATATGGVGHYRYDWYRVGNRKDQWVASGEECPGIPAGHYKVRVTDGNGIVAWAEAYALGQPELLKVRTEVAGLLCDGDTNGRIKAIAGGGTLPYQYLWTTGDEAVEISGLAAGRYLVMVKDGHGCLAEALGTVVSPTALAVTANVTDPVCFGETGNVVLTVTGGTGKHQILWADGNTKPERDDLQAGHYPVEVTDANGCLWKDELVLSQPEQLVVDLGKERTLCRGQQSELLPLNVQKVSRYKWFKDGQEFASKSSVKVSEAGLYRLEIQTRQGCLGEGEVRVNQNDAVIDANFAMASEVETGDLLKVVNTCLPMPSYCEWIIPQVDGLEIRSNDKDLAELLFARTGEYTIGLRSVEKECEETLYKSVKVIPEGIEQPLTRAAERIIGDIQAWPNPNDGHFRVRISLNRKADGLMRLYALTGLLLREQKCEGAGRYELTFNESLPTGIYIIHVIFGNEREAVKIMVE